ncbi:Hypothetical protein PBC10988_15240 [Planctomycetales bacterium 10988]|nr:Hypothetical protein PBC10988_15240 [Planctomycetales bacterium 10988]
MSLQTIKTAQALTCFLFSAFVVSAMAISPTAVSAEEMDLSAVKVTAPDSWVQKQPRSSIVAYEYAAPASEGDSADGRFTVMAAGGDIQANIDRWSGQFAAKDGEAKVTKVKAAGYDVSIVDISGTFVDTPRGFFGPKVNREGYRMMGAIVDTSPNMRIYLKFYGPKKTVSDHEKAFMDMIEGMKKS